MTDFAVRPLEETEQRAACNVFRASVHDGPIPDDRWRYISPLYEPGRGFGAFAADKMVGTTMSFSSTLTLPGGAVLPLAAVTYVGVRADHRRRGVLAELMRAQLGAAAAAGDVFAGLHASEAGIYGRFGYGIGTMARTVTVNSRRAEFRPEVPRGGEVRLLDIDEALSLLPKVYERTLGRRPGNLGRSAGWWTMAYERRLRCDNHTLVAVHTGPDGEDGFVTYLPQSDGPHGPDTDMDVTLGVPDLQGTPAAINDLWRFLLSVDLVGEVKAFVRPMDEPIEAMLVNQHVVHSEQDDDLWLRLVDVPAALAGRDYADTEPIVLEVRDRLLPANSGRYRVSPHGTGRTDDPVSLAMDVDALAMIYLGTSRASTLAGIGRVEVTDPAALSRADRLFATDGSSWCGTLF